MKVFGLSWGEWAAVFTIVAGLFGGMFGLVNWLYRNAMDKFYSGTIAPSLAKLEMATKQMTEIISDFRADSRREHEAYNKHLERLDAKAIKHGESIKSLWHELDEIRGYTPSNNRGGRRDKN